MKNNIVNIPDIGKIKNTGRYVKMEEKQDEREIKKQAFKDFAEALIDFCDTRAQACKVNSKEAPDVELAGLYEAQSNAYSDVKSYCALLIGILVE